MQNTRSGKALVSTIIVIVWLAIIGGGVYWFVTNEAAKAKFAAEEAKRVAEEAWANEDRPKGLGVPRLSVPEGYVEKKRTEPFKYIFSDNPSTRSAAGAADTSAKYSGEKQSDEDFDAGMLAYLLDGAKCYSKEHQEETESVELESLLEKILQESQKPDGDVASHFEALKPFVEGQNASSDPFVQHIAGIVYLASDKEGQAQQFLLGAINDYPKFKYPSRFPVLAMTQRINTKPKKIPTFISHERHVDAIAYWMQEDFSESGVEHRYCWSILKDAIASVGADGNIDAVKKIMDKHQDKAFISPWLAEMISAHYYIQKGKSEFASDEVIANARKHLAAAQEISPNFPEAKADMEVVEKMENPGGDN